jgi:hypothetical protein
LLELGKIPENASVEEIAALLAGGDDGKSIKDAGGAEEPAAGAETDGDGAAKDKGEVPVDNKTVTPESTDGKDTGGAPSSGTAQEQEPTGPITNKSGTGTIPFGVLDGTRKRLAQAEENLRKSEEERQAAQQRADDLERQLAQARTTPTAKTTRQVQDIADQAGITDAQGRPIDVTKIDIASLRGEFPAPIVDMLETFQKALIGQQTTIQQLRQRDQQRVAKESLTEEEQIQADIDAVPKLAEWAAAPDPAMFNRAVALDNALLGEPKWQNATRLERYQEVARILGGETAPAAPAQDTPPAPKPSQQPAQVKQKVSDALQRAAARSAPISHSDLPAGAPAAQSEHESLEAMDVLDIAAKMENMTPEQQQAYIDRFA